MLPFLMVVLNTEVLNSVSVALTVSVCCENPAKQTIRHC